jgi:hypothetical protein
MKDINGNPFTGARYEYTVGGHTFQAVTGADGLIEHEIPRDATNHPSAKKIAQEKVVINGTISLTLGELLDAAKFLQLWLQCTRRHGATPDVDIDYVAKEGDALLRSLSQKRFQGRKISVMIVGQSVGVATELGPSLKFPPDNFPKPLVRFTLRPLTSPVVFKPGDTIDIPAFGHPAHMEWWHFQYAPGYQGRSWGDILADVGWTREGLLRKSGRNDPGIYGHWGLGYAAADLSKTAR